MVSRCVSLTIYRLPRWMDSQNRTQCGPIRESTYISGGASAMTVKRYRALSFPHHRTYNPDLSLFSHTFLQNCQGVLSAGRSLIFAKYYAQLSCRIIVTMRYYHPSEI